MVRGGEGRGEVVRGGEGRGELTQMPPTNIAC